MKKENYFSAIIYYYYFFLCSRIPIVKNEVKNGDNIRTECGRKLEWGTQVADRNIFKFSKKVTKGWHSLDEMDYF